MNIQRLILIIMMMVGLSTTMATAQQRGQRLSSEDRQKYLAEMRAQKHEFLTKELNLTRDQQNAFFPIYDQMDDELNRIAEETRQLESKVNGDTKASDIEIESAARAIFEQKVREGNVEIEYFAKFKEILKPRQLLGLKNAERNFTRQLVRQHGRMQNK